MTEPEFDVQRFAETNVTRVAPELRMQAWAKSDWEAGLQTVLSFRADRKKNARKST